MFWLRGLCGWCCAWRWLGLVRGWRVVTGRRSDWGGAVGAELRWVAEVGAKRPGAAPVSVGAGRSGGAGDGGQELPSPSLATVQRTPEPSERAAAGFGFVSVVGGRGVGGVSRARSATALW